MSHSPHKFGYSNPSLRSRLLLVLGAVAWFGHIAIGAGTPHGAQAASAHVGGGEVDLAVPEHTPATDQNRTIHGMNKASEPPEEVAKARDLIFQLEGPTSEEPWQVVMRQASLAAKRKDFKLAEGLFAHAFVLHPSEEAHKRGLLEMAAMYEETGQLTKMAAIYEKFVSEFPEDSRLAQVYTRLGFLYRDMGAYNTAISRFYSVLNSSLQFEGENFDAYRDISQRAQLAVAETYLIMGDLEQAQRFFDRVRLIDLKEPERMNVMFKAAYLAYLKEDYANVATALEEFLNDYPTSDFAPEAHFLLANAYNQLKRSREAVSQVLKLLRSNTIYAPQQEQLWEFWRKKTANQLANEFYEQGDFLSALKIYQVMAPLNRSPQWQWPVIYQIGLCFERLRMYPKATEAYQLIADETEWKDTEFNRTDTLNAIQEMAQWRLKHIDWADQTKGRLREVLNSPQASTSLAGG